MQKLINQVLSSTQEGMNLMLEVNQLCDGAMNMKADGDFASLVEEIVSKQKRAVECVQNAMQIEKSILKTQSERLEALRRRI